MSPATRAALLAIAGDGVLTVMDTLIKGLTASYPTLQIAALRFGCGLLVAGALFAWLRPGVPTRAMVRAHAVRSLLVVVTATSFFYALGKLPLAEAIALSFLSPLFMIGLGAVLLGERLDARIAVALATGLFGMLLISAPHFGQTEYGSGAMWGIAAVLVSTVSYALVTVMLRARALVDPAITIVLFQNAGPALLLAAPAALVWQPMPLADLAIFMVLGLLGVTGHLLLANAFRLAEAARLAPLHYFTLVWAMLLGFAMFGEVPGLLTIAGAALIVAGTVGTHRSMA